MIAIRHEVSPLKQEAYSLIDQLSADSVQAIIQVMLRMLPKDQDDESASAKRKSEKMQAFMEMQEMRKKNINYDFSDAQRMQAMDERFGKLSWSR